MKRALLALLLVGVIVALVGGLGGTGPAKADAPPVNVSGSLSVACSADPCSTGSTLTASLPGPNASCTFNVSANASSNTIQFEQTNGSPAGGPWAALSITPSNITAGITSTTSTVYSSVVVLAGTAVRARLSNLVSGSTTVQIACGQIAVNAYAASALATLQFLPVFNVVSYGAKCNALTDDTTAIQNTINTAGAQVAAGTIGGAYVYLPSLCAVTSTVTNSWNNVKLLGAGTTASHTVGTSLPITSGLKWRGAASSGPIYQIAPSPSASAQFLTGDDITNVEFTGNNNEQIDVSVLATRSSVFSNIFIDSRATQAGMYFGGVSTIGDNDSDSQLILSNIRCESPGFNDPNTTSCFYFDAGSAGGNFNFNMAFDLACNIKKATCLAFNNADNNYFYNTYCFMANSGTGLGIDFKSGVNAIVIDGYGGGGANYCPMLVETGSFRNQIRDIDQSNGLPVPTIQPSSDVNWTFNGDESITFTCASVAVTGTACSFPGGFRFHQAAYVCSAIVEGNTAASVSYQTETVTGFTAYSSNGTPTVDFTCTLRKVS